MSRFFDAGLGVELENITKTVKVDEFLYSE